MSRNATYSGPVESDETAEVIVRQSPAELEAPAPIRKPTFTGTETAKPAAAILPIYLRELGSTPLIDERQEVDLARELQDARQGIAKIARRMPAAVRSHLLAGDVAGHEPARLCQ